MHTGDDDNNSEGQRKARKGLQELWDGTMAMPRCQGEVGLEGWMSGSLAQKRLEVGRREFLMVSPG